MACESDAVRFVNERAARPGWPPIPDSPDCPRKLTFGSLTGDLRENAVLRAGYIAGADYVTWQHEVIARDVGLSAAQVEAVKAGGSQGHILSPVQQAVMDFVDDVIINVRASDATLAAVRQHLSDEQVIDLIFCTGLY
ncbi:MAG: carboxymuconolactone decarboxylase family protein, partial [Rhizobiaceae bacterium]